MSNWFESKVRYQKIDETGKVKNVTETYLLDAVSFTEAEKRINQEMEPYISGEFTVTTIKLANFEEVIPGENGDRWFKCKVSYIAIDEEKGMERKTNSYILLKAFNVKDAYEKLEKEMSTTMSDYEIASIQESPILDVFPYEYSSKDFPSNSSMEDLPKMKDFEKLKSEFEESSEEMDMEEDIEEQVEEEDDDEKTDMK